MLFSLINTEWKRGAAPIMRSVIQDLMFMNQYKINSYCNDVTMASHDFTIRVL